MAEQDALVRLRRSLGDIDAREWIDTNPSQRFPLGVEAIDAILGGGLPRGTMHEVFAASFPEAGAACGFGLGLALRMAVEGRVIVWVQQIMARQEHGGIHPHGLIEFGASPSIILVEARDGLQAMRAAHEALHCSALGAVVLELWGRPKTPDLTASRKLSMASAGSGVGLVSLHLDAEPQPSAAFSRWNVAASPSVPLEAGAPGNPCFDLTLLRHRGGFDRRQWRVEWNRDQLVFREPPLSGALVPLPSRRPSQATEWRRAG